MAAVRALIIVVISVPTIAASGIDPGLLRVMVVAVVGVIGVVGATAVVGVMAEMRGRSIGLARSLRFRRARSGVGLPPQVGRSLACGCCHVRCRGRRCGWMMRVVVGAAVVGAAMARRHEVGAQLAR